MSSGSRKLYLKAALLVIAFFVVFIVSNSLVRVVRRFGSSPAAIVAGANSIPLTDDEQKRVQRSIAGFWQCTAARSDDSCLSVTDRFELKDNGIFWRVKRTVIDLGGGDSAAFEEIGTGYLDPTSRSKTSPDSLTCQIHFISQVVIAGTDTCYSVFNRQSTQENHSILPQLFVQSSDSQGSLIVDAVWNVVANGERFDLENRAYRVYDTAGAALHSFFPPGAIRLVGNISVRQCAADMTLEQFAKTALALHFPKTAVATRSPQDIRSTVDFYYRDLFLRALAKRTVVYGKGAVTVSFSVDKHGKVLDPNVLESKPLNMKLNDALKKEIQTWAFPICSSQDAPVKVEYSFSY